MALTFEAGSMAELADFLLTKAAEKRESADRAVRKALKKELIAQAYGIEFAAGIVRDTVIRAERVSA